MHVIKHTTGILFLSFLMLAGCRNEPGNIENDASAQPASTQNAVTDSLNTPTPSLIPIESSDTQSRVAARQQQLRDAQNPDQDSAPDETEFSPVGRYRLDVAPYNQFADKDGYVNFIGVELERIQQVLGDAPIVVRQSVPGAPVRKEVRVYMPYQEDATGLYLFIQNEVVQDFRMDEFNGIRNSSILDYFSTR